jgi:hypothetical protein
MIVYQCQVCHRPCFQETDDSGFPERAKPCPYCELESLMALKDMTHLTEARRLYLALAYVTAALDHTLTGEVSADWRRYYPDQAKHYDRVVSRAVALLAEMDHLKRTPGHAETDTDEAPAPGHDLGQGGEHRQEARVIRGEPG